MTLLTLACRVSGVKSKPQHPWISNATSQIIARWHEARQYGNINLEKKRTVNINRNVNDDQARWLEDLLTTGDWAQIRKLRRGFSPKKNRLLSKTGEVLDSDDRAEAFAQHFEEAQWHIRTVTERRPHAVLEACFLYAWMRFRHGK